MKTHLDVNIWQGVKCDRCVGG